MSGQPISAQRLPVAMETLDEPLYVNAKQYHRIIKRRQARAKLEAEGKIPKVRKVLSSKRLKKWDIIENLVQQYKHENVPPHREFSDIIIRRI